MQAPLDEEEFRRWRDQAARALEAARLAGEGGQHEWACFLSEQAAQLAVKGLLHGAGLEAWGHDLTLLSSRVAAELASAWEEELSGVAARLSRHYIPTRYPDAHASGPPGAHYTENDGEQAMADARRMLAGVDGAWRGLEEVS